MTFLGYTDFKKQTVQKIILDERSLTSKKVVKESQVKLQGAFVELADHALYRTQYVCLEGDSYPLNEWGKGDLIFLAYLNRSDTFLLNLTKGDFVGTDFLGELEETKALDAVISVEEKGVTLETLGVGFILVSDGDRLKSWQAQDEVIVRLFRAVGEKLILNQENAHGVRCALLQNVTRNKIALVQGFVKP